MSVVRAGKIHHNMSIQEIRKMINEYFSEDLPAPEMTKTKFEKILEEGLNAELSEAEQKPKTENSGV
jgi:hypothetical protein